MNLENIAGCQGCQGDGVVVIFLCSDFPSIYKNILFNVNGMGLSPLDIWHQSNYKIFPRYRYDNEGTFYSLRILTC